VVKVQSVFAFAIGFHLLARKAGAPYTAGAPALALFICFICGRIGPGHGEVKVVASILAGRLDDSFGSHNDQNLRFCVFIVFTSFL